MRGHLSLEEHALVRQTGKHPGLVHSSKPEHRLPKRTMIDDVPKYFAYSQDSASRATRTCPSRHESRRLAWHEKRRAQAAGPVGWSRTQHGAAPRQAELDRVLRLSRAGAGVLGFSWNTRPPRRKQLREAYNKNVTVEESQQEAIQ